MRGRWATKQSQNPSSRSAYVNEERVTEGDTVDEGRIEGGLTCLAWMKRTDERGGGVSDG